MKKLPHKNDIMEVGFYIIFAGLGLLTIILTLFKIGSFEPFEIGCMIITGIIFGAIGAIPLFLMSRKRKKIKDLIEFGNYIYAVVDSVEEDLSTSAGKKHNHPYIVYCTHTDEVTGMQFKFKSESMWRNPQPMIKEGTRIKVYVDDADYINHYVNVEEALEQISGGSY